ncbi:MAG: TetR/AcrR family transcriptional regulator [Sulfurovum sp.]|nr:TetR/AcrR family transcriptional regulator [Sulfurovum sp.]
MAIQKTSKEKILKVSAKLFKIKGYYNTTMSDIASACGLLKGSIYHHFKSKDEIGLETLKYIHSYFNDNIFKIAYNKDITPLEQIKLFVKKTDHYFLNSEGGCLLGNLALEVSWSNLDFKNEIKEYFLNWEKALTIIFENKFDKTKSKELSKEFVALIQGEIMMMNLHNDKERYLKVGKKMIQLLE